MLLHCMCMLMPCPARQAGASGASLTALGAHVVTNGLTHGLKCTAIPAPAADKAHNRYTARGCGLVCMVLQALKGFSHMWSGQQVVRSGMGQGMAKGSSTHPSPPSPASYTHPSLSPIVLHIVGALAGHMDNARHSISQGARP